MADLNELGELFIEHYGKKGMRWGSRSKSSPTLGSSKESKRASASLAKAKKHSVKSLSNKELSDLNNRLGLEQRYSQLNPTKAQKGAEFAKKFSGNIVKTTVTAVATQQIAKALKTVIK